MNKLFTKIATAIAGFAMVAGVGVGIGLNVNKQAKSVDAATSSYSLTFSTGSGDGTSASTSTASSSVLSAGSAYVSGNLATATKVYYSGDFGLKLGTSSKSGAIKINLSTSGQVKASTVVVNAKRYSSSNAATLSVNGITAQNVTSSFTNLTFTINGDVTYLQFDSSKYIWLSSVTVNYTYCSVAYDGNNNTGGTAPVDSTKYKAGSTVTVAANTFVRDDFNFIEWNTAVDGSGDGYDPGDTFSISQDTTLYAQWQSIGSDPYVSLQSASVSGYTGQNPIIGFSFGNFTSPLVIESEDSDVVRIGTIDSANPAASTVQLHYDSEGDADVYFNNGSSLIATLSVHVDPSAVTITGLPASANVNVDKTLNLGDTITVTPVGSYSDSVTWHSDNESIATVSGAGVVTGVGKGTTDIVVTSVDDENTIARCAVTVNNIVRMEYPACDTTGSLSASDDELNASTLCLNASRFSVSANKGETSNLPGVNKVGDFRLYNKQSGTGNGSYIVVTIATGYVITNIQINFKQNPGAATVSSNGQSIQGNAQYVYAINNKSFKVQNTSTSSSSVQVQINYIDITFETVKEFIKGMNTQTALAYHYESDVNGDYTYTNTCIRFGGNISKILWNELDTNEHRITGFGVVIAEGNKADTQTEMEDIAEISTLYTFSEDVKTNDAIDYFVPIEDLATVIGQDENNYFWNLRFSVAEEDFSNDYSAAAYIKLGDEYVLMNMAMESVTSIAADYLNNRGYDVSPAANSLQYIVDNF